MKRFIFTLFSVGITICLGCMATIPIHTEQDTQQLEEAKEFFKNQFEDDMHPIIQAYLVEVLPEPSSFRLERFDYMLANYPTMIPDKKRTILPSKSPKTLYKQVLIPAYHINMLFRHTPPTRGTQLEEMRFYLLKDKQLILPNNLAVSLIE